MVHVSSPSDRHMYSTHVFKYISTQQGQLGTRRRGKPVKSTTIDVQTYSAGGSFLRLEQDWRESHLAYLQHKTCLSVRSNRPSSAGKISFS